MFSSIHFPRLTGDVRVGLEDNLYLAKGQLATNAQLVERARAIVENMGSSIQTPQEARETLNLKKQTTRSCAGFFHFCRM